MTSPAGLDPNLSWTPPQSQLDPITRPSPVQRPTIADLSNQPRPSPAPVQPQPQQQGWSLFNNFMEAAAFGYNFFFNPVGAINNVGRIVTQDAQTEALPSVETPVSLALAAEGPVFRGANTALAGTILLADVGGNGIRPGEDGISIGDVADVYRRSWEYEITPGQAIATDYAGYVQWLLNAVYPEGSNALDSWIEAENAKALADPSNTRGLNHWLSGFHSEFDVDDRRERDSAFGQGVGRWITGTSDAAIYWFVGVDVLAAKAATGIYRSATTKFLATYGNDSRRGVQSLDRTKANIIAHQAGVRNTIEGEIVDELVGLNSKEAAFHDLAKFSDNQMAVSNAIGAVQTRSEAKLLFLALLGDVDSLAALSKVRTEAADALHLAKEQRDTLAQALDGNPGGRFAGFAPFGWHSDSAVAHFDKLADEATEEANRLKDLTSFLSHDGNQLAGIGRATKIGGSVGRKQSKVVKGIRVQKRAGADAGYGKLSAQRQAEKARRRLATFNGSAYQHTVFKMFGRGIRFVSLRSAADRLGTHRQSGTINFADPNEFLEEIKSVLSATPFLRRIAKAAARGDETARVVREQPNGELVSETIDEFRDRILQTAIQVSRQGTRQKGQFLMDLEKEMVLAMAYNYKMSAADMLEVAARYSTARSRVRDHLAEHSWLKDGTDLVVLQQETLTRLRNGFNLMDFNYIENVLRLSAKGSTGSGKTTQASRVAIEAFDSVWRPLVLLRLGYTQRNVAEGWLRIAAATGEFPTSGDAAQSFKMFALNAGDRLAGGATNVKRAALNRRGRRKAKKESRRVRGMLQDDLNKRREIERELARVDRNIKARRRIAKFTAQERVLDSQTKSMTLEEGPVYNQISDEVTEAQLRLIEDADTLIYAEGDVFSLHARALATPDPNTGVGVADAEALTRSAMGDQAEDLADQFDLYEWMTPGMQRQWDDLSATQMDESGNWISLEAAEQGEGLKLKAYNRRIQQLLKADYRIGVIDDGGRFKRLRTTSIAKLSLDDFLSGKVVAVPKSVNPQYAKVDVYGGMLDLRTNVQQEVFNANSRINRLRSFTRDVESAGGLVGAEDIAYDLDPALRGLLGDEVVDLPALGAYGEEQRLIFMADALLQMADESPEIVRAIAVNKWIRDNSDRLPEGFIAWAEKNKLIISNREVGRRIRRQMALQRQADNLEVELEQLRSGLSDLSRFPRDVVAHAGEEIPGDVVPDVLVNGRTLFHAVGPGLYSTFDDAGTQSSFLTMHLAQDGIPVVYLLPHPSTYAWIDLTQPLVLQNGELNPIAQDIVEVLSDARFTLRGSYLGSSPGDTLGSYYRRWSEAGNGAILDDLWRQITGHFGAGDIVGSKADEEVVYDIIDSIRSAGYDGLFRGPGPNPNVPTPRDIYVWWTKDLPLERAEDITDEALSWYVANQKLRQVEARIDLSTSPESQSVLDALRYGGESMTTTTNVAGSVTANARIEQLLTRFARERGYGGVYLDDPGTVEGYRALFTPDVSSINAGYLDDIIPGQVAQAGRGKASIADLSKARGKQLTEVRLAQGEPDAFDFPDSKSYLQAMREWRETGGVTQVDDVPARAKADISTNSILQSLRDFDPALYRAVTGPGAISKNNRAKLAIWMQQGGYTHLLLPGKGRNADPVLMSASELIADRKTGLAYLRYGAKDEVDEVFTSILNKDDEYNRLLGLKDDASRRAASVGRSVAEHQAILRKLADDIDRTRPSRFKKRRVGDSGDPDKDRMRFVGPRGEAVVETGSYRDPNEALSGVTQSMWSSGSTTDYMIAGRIQNGHAQLQSTGAYKAYTPGDDKYWDAMEVLVNQTVREDPIMRRLASRSRAVSDDDIDAQNAELIEELMEDAAFMAAVDDGVHSLDNLPLEINEIRNTLYRWVPDQQVLLDASKGKVDADYLQSRLNWRDDLVSIEERELVEVRNPIRRFFNRAMNVLGTLPEDALIKGPFYRKRWNEEMQRQVNAYEESGVDSFTSSQIDAMRRQAHAYALRSTRETTYTISRLSTPAAAMAFIIPFFPAWENAVRFWSKRFVSEPSTLARYIQLWNAPNAMGMVVDEDGNPVEGRRGFGGLTDALVSPGETYLIIPVPEWSKAALDKLPFVGLGQKGQLRIAKGALNVALQGDYPWMANAGPLVSVPISYIAAQNPDYFAAIKGLEFGDAKIGDAIAKFFVPFGRPTSSKNIIGAALEQAVPAAPGRIVNYVEGMSDVQFVAAVEEIHRDMVVDWEKQGGYETGGAKPDYAEAIARAQELAALQFAGNITSPAAPGYQSKYQIEIEEWRRILKKHLDIEQQYRDQGIVPDPDQRVGYQAALREFLDIYGDAFFALTQSTSGRSGVGASLSEYDILKNHGDLAGKLAGKGGEESSEFAAMITSPYRGEFDEGVYAWQLNRRFNNSQKLIRGGERDNIQDKTEIQRGWIKWTDGLNGLEAIAEQRGTTVEKDEELSFLKKALEASIEETNPAWYQAKGEFETRGYIQIVENIEVILSDERFMRERGSEPIWQDVRDWYERREEMMEIILQRKIELGDSGSMNIKASSNADLFLAWELFIEDKRKSNIAFAEYYNRWLDYDNLLPGDPSVALDAEVQIANREMVMGGVPQ